MFSFIICIVGILAVVASQYPAWEAKSYTGGSLVSHEGSNYRAKWWANPDQVPGTPVDFDHQTPWAFFGSSGPKPTNTVPTGTPTETPTETPTQTTPTETPTDPPTDAPTEPSGGKGKGPTVSPWVKGTAYAQGDVVSAGGKTWKCKGWPATGWCADRDPAGPTGFQAWDECTGAGCGSGGSGGKGGKGGKGNPTPPKVPTPPKGPTGTLRRSVMEAEERRITNIPLIQKYKAELAFLSEEEAQRIAPGRSENPENVKRVESLITAQAFDYLFPKRNAVYSFGRFLQAVGKFPRYCGAIGDAENSERVCRKSVATSFAHFAQETGGNNPWWTKTEGIEKWRQGLFYIREYGRTEETRGQYNNNCAEGNFAIAYPCGKFPDGQYFSYFGRGSKQLSWNYNYAPFSAFIYNDKTVLLNNPADVAE
eukprot:Filipodium_phascolosomae@DN7974_c0_g1_i1.p1